MAQEDFEYQMPQPPEPWTEEKQSLMRTFLGIHPKDNTDRKARPAGDTDQDQDEDGESMDLSSDVSGGILPAPDADPFPNTEPSRVLLSYKYVPDGPPAFPGSVVRLDGPDVRGPTTPWDESILIYAKLAGRARPKMRIGWADLTWCPAYSFYIYFVKMRTRQTREVRLWCRGGGDQRDETCATFSSWGRRESRHVGLSSAIVRSGDGGRWCGCG
jgi:hypothetical protein